MSPGSAGGEAAERAWDRFGPFYGEEEVAALTGLPGVAAVAERARTGRLLAPATSTGRRVYPAWQFGPDAQVLPGLPDVLQTLLAGTDTWTATVWLATPTERFGRCSAVDLLREGASDVVQQVLAAATEDAARWKA